MRGFLSALEEQRWDDHRLYHRSRVNQSLHLVSALCFLGSYALLFKSPTLAVLVGWMLAMVSRQAGHFFFEPKGYDDVNRMTHQAKEDIKVGYNLRRKIVLLSFWALSPLVLLLDPDVFGMLAPHASAGDFAHNLALMWLAVAVVGLLFRTIHLFFIHDVQTGLVWFTKILTDPFHDVALYHRAPLYLLRGEWLDPMHEVREA